jgi:hypothetical protein
LVFAWFTLRNGYSRTAKIVSFAWLAISLVLIGVQGGQENAPANTATSDAKAAEQVVQAEAGGSSQVAKNEAATPVAQQQNSKPSLGLTLETFVDRFNDHMVKLERPYRLKPKVANNIFSVALNDRLAISGGLSETSGELNSLMIIGGGDGTPQSGLDTMMVVAGAYSAVLGMNDVKTTGPEVLAVLKAHQANPDGNAKRVLNDVKLFYTQSEMMGNFFAIEPASL